MFGIWNESEELSRAEERRSIAGIIGFVRWFLTGKLP
jgi:hypothetical protein